MKYEIVGKTVPVVEVTLNKGESMFTQKGAMAWQTQGISMKTNAHGGVMKSLGRMFTGESIFMNTFTADVDNVKISGWYYFSKRSVFMCRTWCRFKNCIY